MAVKVNGRATHTPKKPAGSSNPKLGIFFVSNISTYKSNIGEMDRQRDRQNVFFLEVPQSSAFPFTLRVRSAFSLV